MRKVLITGANGFLGRRLVQHFSQSYVVYAADVQIAGLASVYNPVVLDLTNRDAVCAFLDRIRPDLVVNTAAMTNVDANEDSPAQATAINALAPLYLAQAMKQQGGALLHLSTDFIFDGERGNYRETDPPHPLSVYGHTKLQGEDHIFHADLPAIICRSSVLYGWPDRDQRDNFFSWAFKQLAAGQSVRIIDGQITTPTLVDDLVPVLYNLSERVLTLTHPEILHTCGPEAVTRYQFVHTLAHIFEFNPVLVERITELTQKAIRPKNSSLNTTRICEVQSHRFHSLLESFQYLKETRSLLYHFSA